MKDDVNHVVEVIASHPKTAVLVAAAANFNTWWVNWGSPVLEAVTSVLGIILVCILIRYHWQNTKKIVRENKKVRDNKSPDENK